MSDSKSKQNMNYEPDFSIKLAYISIGTLTLAEEAGYLNLFDSQDRPYFLLSLLLEANTDVIDIQVMKDEISSIRQVFGEEQQMEIQLNSESIGGINELLKNHGYSVDLKSSNNWAIEIGFQKLKDQEIHTLQNFFSSVTPADVNEFNNQAVKANDDNDDVEFIEDEKPPSRLKVVPAVSNRPKRETRKKKASEPDKQEPVNKKSRNKKPDATEIIDVDADAAAKRVLRSGRGLRNGGTYIDDPLYADATDSEKREIQKAIERSIQETFPDYVKDAANVLDNEKERKKEAKAKKKKKEPAVDPYANIDKTLELLRYPSIHVFPPFDGEVVFKMEDFLCLGKAEYLSDVIIDFYLNYLYREKFTDELRERVYIFPAQFFSIYSTDANYAGWKSDENAGKTAAQKRYERVVGMLDDSVNIFEKDFLVFPLFKNAHWFLAIVCYPLLTQSVTYDEGLPVDDSLRHNRLMKDPSYNPVPLKSSVILTFDSIKSNHGPRCSVAMIHIRHFLTSHWEMKYKDQYESIGELKSCSIPVPKQTNNVDCGCFLLEFFERFFITDRQRDFRIPLKKPNWFESKKLGLNKRMHIVEVIKEKMLEAKNAITSEVDVANLPVLYYFSEDLVEANNENNDDEQQKKTEEHNKDDENGHESYPTNEVNMTETNQNNDENGKTDDTTPPTELINDDKIDSVETNTQEKKELVYDEDVEMKESGETNITQLPTVVSENRRQNIGLLLNKPKEKEEETQRNEFANQTDDSALKKCNEVTTNEIGDFDNLVNKKDLKEQEVDAICKNKLIEKSVDKENSKEQAGDTNRNYEKVVGEDFMEQGAEVGLIEDEMKEQKVVVTNESRLFENAVNEGESKEEETDTSMDVNNEEYSSAVVQEKVDDVIDEYNKINDVVDKPPANQLFEDDSKVASENVDATLNTSDGANVTSIVTSTNEEKLEASKMELLSDNIEPTVSD